MYETQQGCGLQNAISAPKVGSPISGAMLDLASTQEHTFDLLKQLRDRLGLVLRPEQPQGEGIGKAESPPESDMVADINRRTNAARDINRLLSDSLARLTL